MRAIPKPSLVFLFSRLLALLSHAQSVPALVNYQGRLTDQTGAPLTAGLYAIQFKLWDDPLLTNAADLVWAQQQNVAVQSNGIFDVILGSSAGSPIPGLSPTANSLSLAFTQSNRFLGITVVVSNGVPLSSTSEIMPRQQLLTVPFAVQAQQASSLASNFADMLCPPGTVVAYMGNSSPAGWLLCHGSAISRTNFASLFAVIGSATGAGDGK
jgi:hypothetical protein